VGCKCSQCRVCFDRTGHWDTEREGLNHARSLGHTMTPVSVSSRLLVAMSSDTPLDTHLEGPDCHTQVWLSSQQIEQERLRVRRALNTRYAEGTRGNYTWWQHQGLHPQHNTSWECVRSYLLLIGLANTFPTCLPLWCKPRSHKGRSGLKLEYWRTQVANILLCSVSPWWTSWDWMDQSQEEPLRLMSLSCLSKTWGS